MIAKQEDYADEYQLVLGKAPEGLRLLPKEKRKVIKTSPAKATVAPKAVARALRKTAGAQALLEEIPALGNYRIWLPTATFTVCQKTGTATYLDLWDVDHFDKFTDMQSNLSDCRAWFSADGFSFWGAPETKTGRINCYFKAPTAGNYVCNVELQSYAGSAQVECLIDSFSYGPLPFNGTINQPHVAALSAGYHSFRIRQLTGAFFFISLTIWKV